MMILNYRSKKELKANRGKPLNYTETSLHGPEYDPNGDFPGSNRPQVTDNEGREFFAHVYMKNGLIAKVE